LDTQAGINAEYKQHVIPMGLLHQEIFDRFDRFMIADRLNEIHITTSQIPKRLGK
jgi:hypothetical protein